MPTLLAMIDETKDQPKDLDGISFASTLLGKEQEPRPFLYREFAGYDGQQSLRVGDWKLIRTGLNRGEFETGLYHLIKDPGEKCNVAEEYPEIVKKLEKLMQQEHTYSKLFPLKKID